MKLSPNKPLTPVHARVINCIVATLIAVALAGTSSAGPYADFPEPRSTFPYSATIATGFNVSDDASGEKTKLTWLIDGDGDRYVDFADASSPHLSPANLGGIGGVLLFAVSPSNPRIIYAISKFNSTVTVYISVLEYDGQQLVERYKVPVPRELSGFSTISVEVHTQPWTDKNGGDVVLIVGRRQLFIQRESRHACLVDGTDDDLLADHFTGVVGFPYIEVLAPNGAGDVYGQHIREDPSDRRRYIVTIRDLDGDSLPETIVFDGFPTLQDGQGAYFGCGYDRGTDRLWLRNISGSTYSFYSIGGDTTSASGGFNVWCPPHNEGGPCFDPAGFAGFTTAVTHDGFPVTRVLDVCDNGGISINVVVYEDLNFDRTCIFRDNDYPQEARRVINERDMEFPRADLESLSVPELPELRDDRGHFGPEGSAEVVFAEYGAFPGNRTFRFPFGGQVYDRMWVAKNGAVAFEGPVQGPAAIGSLTRGLAMIAPAWSDSWDLSRVRVHAGYAPVQQSYVTGEAALAFVVEWRGLFAPNGMRTSLRLLLVDDGTFRVDYGAVEVGEMPLVVGYGGPDGGPIFDVTPSQHSWGGQPAGSGLEQVLATEFGPGRPADVNHLWVRWRGYPDFVPATDAPVILDPRLKRGVKITMRARGSRIAQGATLLVDGAERFPLKKNAAGSAWVVTKKARSTPGARSVADVWGDGLQHSIVVENPDGARSLAAALGP